MSVLSVVEFECDRDGRLVRDIEELDLRFVVVEVERIIVNLGRVGKIARNAVEHELHAFVHVRRTAEYADELLRKRRFTDGRDDLFFGFFAFEGVFHELIVEHRYRIDQIRAIFFCLIDHVCGNFGYAYFLTVGTFEIERFHRNEVDDAFEFVFKSDRERHHVRIESEFVAQLFAHADGVRALTVAFVDECDARYVIALELTVDGDRLRLNARDRAQNEDGAVENAQTPFDFDRKVDVSGRIDQVDCVFFPLNLRCRRLNRNAALAFQFHAVHCRADAVFTVYFVNLVNSVAVKQNAFRQSRFS